MATKAKITVEEVLHKTGGRRTKAKGTPKPKHTPSWLSYKSSNRMLANKVKQLKKHMDTHPNDKQTYNRLHSIETKRSLQ